MTDMTNDKKEKQNYLIQQIKQKGYDLVHFSTYLESIKEDGTDVDNWEKKDLVQAVENYKSQPDVYFRKAIVDSVGEIEIEETSSLQFKITVKDNDQLYKISRSYKDIEWIFNSIIKEHPHIFLVKPMKVKQVIDLKTNRIYKDYLPTLQISLEHLYSYKRLFKSEQLNNFFEMNMQEFENFIKKYKVKRSAMGDVYKNFNTKTFDKISKSEEEPLDINTDIFPENIDRYLKYIDKYLEKGTTIWYRFHGLMEQLNVNFKTVSETLIKLSEVSVELFHQVDKLNSTLSHKENDLKKYFLNTNKFFYSNGGLISKTDPAANRVLF